MTRALRNTGSRTETSRWTVRLQRKSCRIWKEGVTIYENFYLDEPVDVDLDGTSDSTMRIFKKREEVNLVCLMKGTFPETADEIAIDRMYADNNSLAETPSQ